MAGRYGDKNPPMKYYDDYRNKYYNPDDEINRPGRNVNWKDIQQGFSLAAAKDDEQDSSITELEEKNAEQDTRLDAAEENNAEQDTRLDAIETEQTEQNGRLTAIETEQTEQNGRLTAIETEQTAQNNRLDAIEAKDSEQDVAIAAIRAKDADQDTAIGNLTEDISDLETRMSDAEQDIQNENQRNTAQDQSISDNSVRITRLESSQATQDQQITSLITTSVDHGSAINNLSQQVAAAADKVRRVATDPPTSRSTRLGSDESNLTIAAAKDAEGTSVQITDTSGGDPIRVGFESDAGGDSIIIGNNSYKLGESAENPVITLYSDTADHFTINETDYLFNATNIVDQIKPGVVYNVIANNNKGILLFDGKAVTIVIGNWNIVYAVTDVSFHYIYYSHRDGKELKDLTAEIPANTTITVVAETGTDLTFPILFNNYTGQGVIYGYVNPVFGTLNGVVIGAFTINSRTNATTGNCDIAMLCTNTTSVSRRIEL